MPDEEICVLHDCESILSIFLEGSARAESVGGVGLARSDSTLSLQTDIVTCKRFK
jgi:hypothetical protein